MVKLLLRLESLVMLVAAVALYAHVGASWTLFGVLFLAPDLSFAAYLAGPRLGAIVYDAVHNLVAASALAAGGLFAPALLPLGLIWIAHISLDRTLGYGLKYARGFGSTHLGDLPAARR